MASVRHSRQITRAIREICVTSGVDAAIAALAASQFGVVTRLQLLGLGLDDDGILRRLVAGRLHRVHAGVYAVGHPLLSQRGLWFAAVEACGKEAALGDTSAAALQGLIQPLPGAITVIAPGVHSHDGLVVRRSHLAPDDITTKDGIPVTTVERTLLDLSVVRYPRLERALREADVLGVLSWPRLKILLERHARKPGTARLRALVETGRARTRSELEDRFRALVLAENLPAPVYNAAIELDGTTYELDVFWPEHALIVELDGHAFHANRAAFDSDRERDRKLAAAGFVVIRVTWKQLERPKPLLADLRALLSR